MRVLCPQLLVVVFVSLDQALLVQFFTVRGHAPIRQNCTHGLAWCNNYELPIYHVLLTPNQILCCAVSWSLAVGIGDDVCASEGHVHVGVTFLS